MKIESLSAVKDLIASTDSSAVELLESTAHLDHGMETLCAFLNGTGGTVIFGVTYQGQIVGQEISNKITSDLDEAIRHVEPYASIDVSIIAIPDTNKSIIALSVEEHPYTRAFTYKGNAYQRIDGVTSKMPHEQYHELLMQLIGRYSWEALEADDLKISDLDEDAILRSVRGGVRSGRLPKAVINDDVETILKKFNLLHNGKLFNAAVVLFGRDFYYYPQCLLRMARFKGTNKEIILDSQRINGNIFDLLDKAMAFLFKHLNLSGKIEGLYREEELEIPYKALRECCLNAFCHRAYYLPGFSVGIAIYDDRVEIENSGPFTADISMDKLLIEHTSTSQNHLIANVLYKSGLPESFGGGTSLMINECRRVQIPDPEFHTNGNGVWVVFRRAV